MRINEDIVVVDVDVFVVVVSELGCSSKLAMPGKKISTGTSVSERRGSVLLHCLVGYEQSPIRPKENG